MFSKRFASLAFHEIGRILNDDALYQTISACDYSDKDLKFNASLMSKWNWQKNRKITSMTWFFPGFSRDFAGSKNILMLASFFMSKGIKQQFVIVGPRKVSEYCMQGIKNGKFGWNFRGIKMYINPNLEEVDYTDVTIATRWDTAYPVLKFRNTAGKYYFIQDDERLLYPAGDLQALAELTYKFGFVGITNSLELKHMYEEEFGGKAAYFFPSPNTIYKPIRSSPNKKIRKIWFYARTRSDRNGFHLGMMALKEIKKRHPDVEIFLSGEASKKAKPFMYNDLGVLKTLGDLARLYAECDVGLYLVFSRHTGVIPFDLMASGCISLTNSRPYRVYKLNDRKNCLMCDPTPTGIADAFDALYYDLKLRKTLVANGFKTVRRRTIEQELEGVYNYMLHK